MRGMRGRRGYRRKRGGGLAMVSAFLVWGGAFEAGRSVHALLSLSSCSVLWME